MNKRDGTHRNFRLHDGKKGVALAVRVVPESSKDELSAILDDGTIQVNLSSPLEEVEKNQRLEGFLAKVLKVPSSNVEVVAGFSGQEKLVAILDLDVALAQKTIKRYLEGQ